MRRKNQIFLFKLLFLGRNTLLKPGVPLFRLHFAVCRSRRRLLNCVICLEVKNKLQLSSGGTKTIYGLSGNHLHCVVANLLELTLSQFYTDWFGFKADMARNILVCFFYGTQYISRQHANQISLK